MTDQQRIEDIRNRAVFYTEAGPPSIQLLPFPAPGPHDALFLIECLNAKDREIQTVALEPTWPEPATPEGRAESRTTRAALFDLLRHLGAETDGKWLSEAALETILRQKKKIVDQEADIKRLVRTIQTLSEGEILERR
jgi:hypothetical protein